MTPDEINQTIAELFGWTGIYWYEDNQGPAIHVGTPPSIRPPVQYGFRPATKIPNYYGDEAVIRQALRDYPALDEELFVLYLNRIVGRDIAARFVSVVLATGPQLCEAFLQSVSKWRSQ